MNIKLAMTLERALQSYSIDAASWWDGAGDTDQMLGVREWIEERFSKLNPAQLGLLRVTDERVAKLVDGLTSLNSWDAVMLKRIADIAHRHNATA